MMRSMTKGSGEPHIVGRKLELGSRGKRTTAPSGAASAAPPNTKEAFVQAFVDALRDILRDERRRAA